MRIECSAPWATWIALAVVLIIGLFFWLGLYRARALSKLGIAPRVERSPLARRGFVACAVVGWIAAAVALMGPQGNPRPPEEEQGKDEQRVVAQEEGEGEKALQRKKAHDVIFLLDASQSMAVCDSRPGLSRLEYAKEIIDEMVGRLDGQSAALYAFTSEVTPLVPATLDYLYLRLLLRRVGFNEGDVAGTDLMEALEEITRRHGGFVDKARTLVLLTDGGDTRLERASGSDRQQELAALLSRVDGEKMQVLTIGLGSHEGEEIPDVRFEGGAVRSTLDEDLLRQVADKGKGSYYFANDYSSLTLADALHHHIQLVESEIEEEVVVPNVEVERNLDEGTLIYDRYYQFPLLLAVFALGSALLIRARGVLCSI